MKSFSENENDPIDQSTSNQASVSSNVSNRPRNKMFNENLSFDLSTGSNLPESLNDAKSERGAESNQNSEILIDFNDDKSATKSNPFT